jgi:hypothetical protein
MWIEQRMIAPKAIRLGWINPPTFPANNVSLPMTAEQQAAMQTTRLDQVPPPEPKRATSSDG